MSMEESPSLDKILELIDEANARDPKPAPGGTGDEPGELIYGRRMSETLDRIAPGASEELRIAVRAQHIERWKIARSEFPMDKAGYHRWRTRLSEYHAERVGELMARAGFQDESIERVRFLVRKKSLKSDPESALLEDTACLVFLRYYLDDFAARHEREKVVDILRKTWKKMSDTGRAAALKLELSEANSALVGEALAE